MPLHLRVMNLEYNPYSSRLSDLESLPDTVVGMDTLVLGKFAGVPQFAGSEDYILESLLRALFNLSSERAYMMIVKKGFRAIKKEHKADQEQEIIP